eukprot:3338789-Rhodomonas_salina.1
MSLVSLDVLGVEGRELEREEERDKARVGGREEEDRESTTLRCREGEIAGGRGGGWEEGRAV